MQRRAILIAVGVIFAVGAFVAARYRGSLLLRSDPLTGPGAWATATVAAETNSNAAMLAVRQPLLDVGLSEQPYRGSTGVAAHLARLRAGEVTLEAPNTYADDLATLNRLTTRNGVPFRPTSEICATRICSAAMAATPTETYA